MVNVKVFMIEDKPVLHATFHDITEMKKQTEIIEQQKIEFETIFKYSKDGIAIFDLTSNFLDFNDAYVEITGYTREELLTKMCISLTVPEDQARSKQAFEDVLHYGFIESFEKSCITKDNKIITINMSLSLMPDKERVIAVAKNITHNKQLESQAKLASMGEMIGNIAHQWRQPLSVISTMASGIAFKNEYGTLKKDELIPSMNQIVEQANYLSQTINDFRNFIKGDEVKSQIDISSLIEKTLSIAGPNLKNNYIEVVKNIEPNLTITGYENELIQAFINIINNSKDALISNDTLEDKYIFITAKQTDNKYEITIKDNGGGIMISVMNRIFEPYFTTKHQSKGTGLGLAMTYKIITEIHEGTIIASNTTYEYQGNEYVGASFTIIFSQEV